MKEGEEYSPTHTGNKLNIENPMRLRRKQKYNQFLKYSCCEGSTLKYIVWNADNNTYLIRLLLRIK